MKLYTHINICALYVTLMVFELEVSKKAQGN